VEHPIGGDDSRHFGPWLPSGDSAYFETLNAGKESIALDLKQPQDREALHALLPRADVLIENFRPGVMEKMGLGWEALSQKYPRLCYTSISGFGQTGPDRFMSAYDCSVQALGGIMSVTGSASRPSEPIRVGISIGDIGAGIYAALGVTAALHHRASSGKGCQVGVPLPPRLFIIYVAIRNESLTRPACRLARA
jgi:CoA:oxalate CoA-transferase